MGGRDRKNGVGAAAKITQNRDMARVARPATTNGASKLQAREDLIGKDLVAQDLIVETPIGIDLPIQIPELIATLEPALIPLPAVTLLPTSILLVDDSPDNR